MTQLAFEGNVLTKPTTPQRGGRRRCLDSNNEEVIDMIHFVITMTKEPGEIKRTFLKDDKSSCHPCVKLPLAPRLVAK